MLRAPLAVLLLLSALPAAGQEPVDSGMAVPEQVGQLRLIEDGGTFFMYQGERIWSPFTDGALVRVTRASYGAELDSTRTRLVQRGQRPEHLSFQVLPEADVDVPGMGIVARQLTMVAETGRDPFYFWRHYYFVFPFESCVVSVYTGHADQWARPELMVPAIQELMGAIAAELAASEDCSA